MGGGWVRCGVGVWGGGATRGHGVVGAPSSPARPSPTECRRKKIGGKTLGFFY